MDDNWMLVRLSRKKPGKIRECSEPAGFGRGVGRVRRSEDILAKLEKRYSFDVAEADVERQAAVQLQEEVYSEEYGEVPPTDDDARAVFLVARDRGGELVATLRVILPESRPFGFEHHVSLDTLLGAGRRPAELGRWCVHREHRIVTSSSGLHLGLMKLAYYFAIHNDISDYVMYAYEDLVRFYRGLYFEDSGGFVHPYWGSVRLMRLDVRALAARLTRSQTRVARFLLEEPNRSFRRSETTL